MQLANLGLTDRMVLVPRTSKSAKNRFLHYGGKLNRLPSSLFGAISAAVRLPVIRETLSGVVREPWVPRKAAADEDESVHSLVSRRFGQPLADNLVSAMMHGIYAGDSRELSAQSILPFLCDLEEMHGSVLRALMPFPSKLNKRFKQGTKSRSAEDKYKVLEVSKRMDPQFVEKMRKTSIYSFPNGLQEIIDALSDHVMATKNTEVRLASACTQIEPNADGFALGVQNEVCKLQVDRVVAALPSAKLAPLLPDLPHLGHNPAATLSVVDVILAPPDGSAMQYKLPIEGFGFLVPRSAKHNPDEILGVVLDSDAVPNQGKLDTNKNPPFIKMTVMMGGPYWRGKKHGELPTVKDVEERALRTLHNMLGIPTSILETHVRYLSGHILKDTIPQYLVGHPKRMQELHDTLVSDPRWQNRLTLLGFSYAGVGINDCVANALDASDAIIQQELGIRGSDSASVGTGLSMAM